MISVRHNLWLLALACFSCTTVTEPSKSDPPGKPDSPADLLFRTVVNDRFFIQSADTTELIVLRNQAEQDSFLAAKEVSGSIPSIAYHDSLVIGIIYGQPMSISSSFMIDSVVVNPDTRQVVVSSHLSLPFAGMSPSAIHSHFIVFPKSNFPIVMAPISVYQEPRLDTIPFVTFMKGSDRFLTPDASQNFLFLIPDKESETRFLDSIHQSITPAIVSFGPFDYTDSLIVCVISRQFNHETPFEIVALVRNPDRIDILIQTCGSYSLPSIARPYHFVALRKQELPFALKELQRIDSWID